MTAHVASLTRTCASCPEQWEGRLDDGRAVYVRTRHHRTTIGVGATLEDAVWSSMTDGRWWDAPDDELGAGARLRSVCADVGLVVDDATAIASRWEDRDYHLERLEEEATTREYLRRHPIRAGDVWRTS